MSAPKPFPVLATERLLLRPFTPADADDVTRLAGEKEVASTTLSIPHPYPEGVAAAWIAGHAESFAKGESVPFAITLRAGGSLAGAIGLEIDRDHRHAELGYWIAKPCWGKGYATEAALAVVRHGFDDLGLHRIFAAHFTRNPTSGRVLEKIGMTHEGHRRGHLCKWGVFEDIEEYGMLRDDLPAPRS